MTNGLDDADKEDANKQGWKNSKYPTGIKAQNELTERFKRQPFRSKQRVSNGMASS